MKWTFPTAGPIAGTPAVVNDRVYAADATGFVYALDRDGNLLWQTQLDVGPTFGFVKVTASALVTNRTVIIGDLSGQIHGLDVDTGDVKWTIRPNPHPFAAIWGSATMVGKNVAIGVSSVEEFYAPFLGPDYHPSFRGSLVLLDPATGDIVWQTYTISDAESAAGSSGSPIWSSPTYDQATNTIYATTGNNYSQPTQGTSDAFIAFDATTGAIKWVNQRTADDEWTSSSATRARSTRTSTSATRRRSTRSGPDGRQRRAEERVLPRPRRGHRGGGQRPDSVGPGRDGRRAVRRQRVRQRRGLHQRHGLARHPRRRPAEPGDPQRRRGRRVARAVALRHAVLAELVRRGGGQRRGLLPVRL